MRTTFSRIPAMTGQQRTALADEFSQSSRIAVTEPVVAAYEVGTVKEWREAALGDLESREADPDVEQEAD
jgi:hypothetical protein